MDAVPAADFGRGVVCHVAVGALSVSRRFAGRARDCSRGVVARAGGDVGGVHHAWRAAGSCRWSPSSAGAICGWSLDWLVRVVDWAEALPGGHFWAPGPALWWVIGFYLGLVVVMLWGKSLATPRWQVAVLCAVDPRRTRAAAGATLDPRRRIAMHFPRDGSRHLRRARNARRPDAALRRRLARSAGVRHAKASPAIFGSAASCGSTASSSRTPTSTTTTPCPACSSGFRVGAVYVSPMMFDWYGATGPSDAPKYCGTRSTRPACRSVKSGPAIGSASAT